jgi:hypothetical protein
MPKLNIGVRSPDFFWEYQISFLRRLPFSKIFLVPRPRGEAWRNETTLYRLATRGVTVGGGAMRGALWPWLWHSTADVKSNVVHHTHTCISFENHFNVFAQFGINIWVLHGVPAVSCEP